MGTDNQINMDVRIEVQVAGALGITVYADAPTVSKKKTAEWLKDNSDHFFERYGRYPSDEERVAFVCTDTACAYAAGNENAFRMAAPSIAFAASVIGKLNNGQLVIHVVKDDPHSNRVDVSFSHDED